ncbi:hypothetical protein PR048_030239 [Dryococelus australis]|uniref:Uncharacterized protein n=1 Tax=Dryococelus australis TaxID=614101 RepID=A0ABQ9G8F3_9NEOP|nr:hypothetical protein PR048_030239 [Dryococelus australis]
MSLVRRKGFTKTHNSWAKNKYLKSGRKDERLPATKSKRLGGWLAISQRFITLMCVADAESVEPRNVKHAVAFDVCVRRENASGARCVYGDRFLNRHVRDNRTFLRISRRADWQYIKTVEASTRRKAEVEHMRHMTTIRVLQKQMICLIQVQQPRHFIKAELIPAIFQKMIAVAEIPVTPSIDTGDQCRPCTPQPASVHFALTLKRYEFPLRVLPLSCREQPWLTTMEVIDDGVATAYPLHVCQPCPCRSFTASLSCLGFHSVDKYLHADNTVEVRLDLTGFPKLTTPPVVYKAISLDLVSSVPPLSGKLGRASDILFHCPTSCVPSPELASFTRPSVLRIRREQEISRLRVGRTFLTHKIDICFVSNHSLDYPAHSGRV